MCLGRACVRLIFQSLASSRLLCALFFSLVEQIRGRVGVEGVEGAHVVSCSVVCCCYCCRLLRSSLLLMPMILMDGVGSLLTKRPTRTCLYSGHTRYHDLKKKLNPSKPNQTQSSPHRRGMLPLHTSGLIACTYHIFYNSPELISLVAMQVK